MFWPNCLACGALGQELLNFYYPKGAILSQKLLNRELLNYPVIVLALSCYSRIVAKIRFTHSRCPLILLGMAEMDSPASN